MGKARRRKRETTRAERMANRTKEKDGGEIARARGAKLWDKAVLKSLLPAGVTPIATRYDPLLTELVHVACDDGEVRLLKWTDLEAAEHPMVYAPFDHDGRKVDGPAPDEGPSQPTPLTATQAKKRIREGEAQKRAENCSCEEQCEDDDCEEAHDPYETCEVHEDADSKYEPQELNDMDEKWEMAGARCDEYLANSAELFASGDCYCREGEKCHSTRVRKLDKLCGGRAGRLLRKFYDGSNTPSPLCDDCAAFVCGYHEAGITLLDWDEE